MAPYDFQALDADAILRSSDGKELLVHKLILSLASPVFQGLFSLPQPKDPAPTHTPIVDVPESSDILKPFIQCLYPLPPPEVSDVAMWMDLYITADKYNAEVVTELLKVILIPRFLETSPFRVYALASRWGLEEEAKIASERTLSFDILTEFPQEDAELMDGVAGQKLYQLHIRCRDKGRAFTDPRHHRFAIDWRCKCLPILDFSAVGQTMRERVAARPGIPAEELYDEVARLDTSRKCSGGGGCQGAFGNVHAWLTSVLKDMHEAPQTI